MYLTTIAMCVLLTQGPGMLSDAATIPPATNDSSTQPTVLSTETNPNSTATDGSSTVTSPTTTLSTTSPLNSSTGTENTTTPTQLDTTHSSGSPATETTATQPTTTKGNTTGTTTEGQHQTTEETDNSTDTTLPPAGTTPGNSQSADQRSRGATFDGVEAVAGVSIVFISIVVILIAAITGRLERRKPKLTDMNPLVNRDSGAQGNNFSGANEAQTVL